MPSFVSRLLRLPIAGIRFILHWLRLGAGYTIRLIDHALAGLRSPWQITIQLPPQALTLSGRVVIFAHSDPLQDVNDYVLTHLAALHDLGCRIIFVSNTGALPQSCFKALEPLCDVILVRHNFGRKWGAWREGLRYLGDDPQISMLLLIDDSRFGPIFPLAPFIDGVNFNTTDAWSLTESWQGKWHLQTYFMAIHPRIMASAAWKKFWSERRPTIFTPLKPYLIDAALSQSLLATGFRLRSHYSHRELCEQVDRTLIESSPPEGERGRMRHLQLMKIDHLVAWHLPLDPGQMLWRQLLKVGHPYFSRDLMRHNPYHVADALDWIEEFENLTKYDPLLIEEDLALVAVAKRRWRKIFGPAVDLAKFLRNQFHRIGESASLIGSLGRSHLCARYVWPDHNVTVGPRVMVFVHFDKNGDVRNYVLQYLRALVDANVSILFVSNSGKLKPSAIESLKPLCTGIIVRRNIGYDFGAWREGLEYLKGSLDHLELLMLANDSVYGPFQPLAPLFEQMDTTKADVWGFTDSKQREWHLQSYFLAFNRRVLRSPAWAEFWRGVRPVKSKSWAISHGELRITSAMLKAGFKCAALFPYQEIAKTLDPIRRIANRGATPFARLRLRHRNNITIAFEKGQAVNPTSDLWRQLLRQGFPFLKRELLRINPSGVPDSLDWQIELASIAPEDIGSIEADLRKSVRNRVA